jgi:hypothetical protein
MLLRARFEGNYEEGSDDEVVDGFFSSLFITSAK